MTIEVVSLFALLAGGLWIGLTLAVTATLLLAMFRSIPLDKLLPQYAWNILTTQELLALPLFILMGELLFRTRLSRSLFQGLAPWAGLVPGRLLHVNVIGCTIFAAISGSSAATTQVIGRMSLNELLRRGYSRDIAIGSLAGAGIPPSNIMIIYGVLGDVVRERPRPVALHADRCADRLLPCARLFPRWLLDDRDDVADCAADREGRGHADLPHPALGQDFTPSPTTRRAQAGSGVRAFDEIWFGIFLVLAVEMAQITPPVGFNLFVIQGLTDDGLGYIARVTLPYLVIMVGFVLLLTLCPGIVTILPRMLYG
jgi:TRAP-type mannitol/chloroaromatic compound transport system permease large subunit